MSPDGFRRIALGMSGAVESAHMGHPDFRANGRIFATLSADGRKGMVRLTPAQQEEFVEANQGVFEPASGAWGRQGCTMVVLGNADADVVGEAMTLAWQHTSTGPEKKKKRPDGPVRKAAKGGRRPR